MTIVAERTFVPPGPGSWFPGPGFERHEEPADA